MSHLPSMTALRCLDASARLQSFTRAAEELHLTQSAVSHNVLLLERHLGVQLFIRRRAGLELTAPGKKYWADIAASLKQIERATESILSTGGQGGTLSLSVTSSFANFWLIPRLQSFVANNPDVTLNLSTRVGSVDFFNSEDDAAIEFCTGPTSNVAARLVLTAGLRPYVTAGVLEGFCGKRGIPVGPLSRNDLEALLSSQVLIRRAAVADAWPQWLKEADIGSIPAGKLESGPRFALMSMALNGVLGGIGIALLPDFMTETAVDAGRLVCLSEVSWTPPQAYYLRWPDWRSSFSSLDRFADWLATQTNDRQ